MDCTSKQSEATQRVVTNNIAEFSSARRMEVGPRRDVRCIRWLCRHLACIGMPGGDAAS